MVAPLILRSIKSFVATLKSSSLLTLVAALFMFDVIIPDFLPFVDELVLFVMTVPIARWKGREREQAEGAQTVEGAAKPPPKNVTPRESRP